jgi:hypothetical protein
LFTQKILDGLQGIYSNQSYLFIEKITPTALTTYMDISATIEGEVAKQEGDKHVNDHDPTRIYKWEGGKIHGSRN